MRAEESLRSGERLGAYALLRRIGLGGFAQVWLARDPGGREVAIKILTAAAGETEDEPGPSVADRFLEEARILKRLKAPGLVEILDVLDPKQTGQCAYVMEKLEGRDLHKMHGELDLLQLVEIFALVAESLGFLHDHDVIHRDVKLGNVFVLDAGGRDRPAAVKLIDFGIAKDLATKDAIRSTATGMLVGTLKTLAPECFARFGGEEIELGHAVDQWGLGVAIFQALTGSLPYDGPSIVQVMDMIRFAPVPPMKPQPRFGRERLPESLVQLVTRALEKKPEARFSSAYALADALWLVLADLGVRRAGPGRRALPEAPPDWEVASSPWDQSLSDGLPAALEAARPKGGEDPRARVVTAEAPLEGTVRIDAERARAASLAPRRPRVEEPPPSPEAETLRPPPLEPPRRPSTSAPRVDDPLVGFRETVDRPRAPEVGGAASARPSPFAETVDGPPSALAQAERRRMFAFQDTIDRPASLIPGPGESETLDRPPDDKTDIKPPAWSPPQRRVERPAARVRRRVVVPLSWVLPALLFGMALSFLAGWYLRG